MEKIFSEEDSGIIIKNALFSLWLGYTTKSIEQLDREITEKRNTLKRLPTFQKRTRDTISLNIKEEVQQRPNIFIIDDKEK